MISLKKLTFRTVLLAFLGLFLGLARPAVAAEQIESFAAEITVNQDTSIGIKETVRYTTDEEKHGIYRYIPYRYSREGLNFTAHLRQISVTDEQGRPLRFEQKKEDGNVVLKIGDPEATFTGNQTYILTYRVENAIQLADGSDRPELYWDITGEGWLVPIMSAAARIESPDAAILEADCYGGPFGSDDGLCRSEKVSANRVDFSYPEMIGYGDNFTVLLALDPDSGLIFPSAWQKLRRQAVDNLVLLPLLLPGVLMAAWWWRRGRDWAFTSWNVFDLSPSRPQTRLLPWSARPIPMVYEPLKDLTPGEAGVLMDEAAQTQDVVAEIIELARKKFLKIEREEKKKLLGKSTDYILTRLKEADAALPEHQSYLLEKLFSGKKTVKLSELKGSFYSHLEKVKQLLFASLQKKQLFAANPQTVRGLAFAGAIVASFLAGAWLIQLLEQEIWWSIPIFLVSDTIALVLAYFMPAKTAPGTNLSLQAKGLRASIARGAWREKIKEKHLFFEEVLPFAIAFGVVDRLSTDMQALNVKPPEYLPAGGTAWNTGSFVQSFNSAASSSLAYNPNSSSWSSGSGGGGSSGGGGGGGGGGSW